MKIIKSKELSSYNNPRFVVIDETTGEMLDNAQGYGYKSAQKHMLPIDTKTVQQKK